MERRILDFLKAGNEKRALRYARARLGTQKRALKKRAQVQALYDAQRKAQRARAEAVKRTADEKAST